MNLLVNGSGGINLTAKNNLYLTEISNIDNHNINIISAPGNVILKANFGNINTNWWSGNYVDLTGYDISLIATGNIDNIGNIKATNGNILLETNGWINTWNSTIITDKGDVNLVSNNNFIFSYIILFIFFYISHLILLFPRNKYNYLNSLIPATAGINLLIFFAYSQ